MDPLPKNQRSLIDTSEKGSIPIQTEETQSLLYFQETGHFARNCPNKSAKVVRLIQYLQQSSILSDNEEVESIFSEQSEKDDHTAFILADSTDSDPYDISVISTIQEINDIRPTLPGPSVKISIIPSKFHKPVAVIGFLDTGAQRSMLNPKILPPDYWDNHTEYFRAANGKVFETSLITKKPIDVNPTKATHLRMPPSDLTLAKQECTQLLRQGLIEPTTSDWVCQAFYVEKRSELVRGKKRLVIDYQPLNAFLKDDKFPLPKIQSLFIHLQGAKVFSKFDLKAGFWQLGISLEDRPKIAFCIPNAHYQWTVLPFDLKVAPSLFQKAMVKIFSSILHHALIYIDDILLFFHDHQTHQQLLSGFLEIVQRHGIMLSEKKSNIGKESIDFLGMVLKDGHYHQGPHITAELLKFHDIDLTKKQIQQFLGIVNYTDASDDFWSAILLEKIGDSESYCAHESGQFKDSEKNYHMIYKEILAVKYGIKKFEFHLISHNFLIGMDNSSFPKIFDFKNKLLPDKQLLNLKTWFAKYDYTNSTMFNLSQQTFTTPPLVIPTLLRFYQALKYVFQDPVPVLMAFLFENNDPTTPIFSSKTLETLGQTFSLYYKPKRLGTPSLNQALRLLQLKLNDQQVPN
ncbi:hypothetical protein KPL71_001168 [Citrus sinensis]|uniref:Uncharacterized protein n=1 Tax=Citrus sinensis TaxID=2711 RepID=A0ACB8NUK9_CITSI|nr:hypothetical protein KPL71_001168 [Citrus sinensis]